MEWRMEVCSLYRCFHFLHLISISFILIIEILDCFVVLFVFVMTLLLYCATEQSESVFFNQLYMHNRHCQHFKVFPLSCFLPVWRGLLLFFMVALFKKASKHAMIKVSRIWITLITRSLLPLFCSSPPSKKDIYLLLFSTGNSWSRRKVYGPFLQLTASAVSPCWLWPWQTIGTSVAFILLTDIEFTGRGILTVNTEGMCQRLVEWGFKLDKGSRLKATWSRTHKRAWLPIAGVEQGRCM